MRKIVLACATIALATPSMASAQVLTTKLYNFVDTPLSVTFSSSGQAQLRINPPAAIISITGYRKVSVQIGSTHATNLRVSIGKITNATLSQTIFNRPVDQNIHTLDVVGPELVIWLTGAPANSTEQIKVWVYLTT
jgi:hypothetical protein